MQRNVQRNPRIKSKYAPRPLVKNRSPTESIESFKNLTDKMTQKLRRNPKVAKYAIVWHILKPMDKPTINKVRGKVLDYLRKEIDFFASIEPTTDGFGNPTDTAHLHILTDDDRGVDFLRGLVRAACLSVGLRDKRVSMASRNEFDVECCPIYNYDGYVDYIMKRGRDDEIYLFTKGEKGKPGTRIQRFYHSGWFVDANGNPKSVTQIWKEIKEETKNNRIRKETDTLKASQDQQAAEDDPPPDIAKLERIKN